MPRLYLKCKTCDTEFASGISVDKKAFETLILSGNQHTCPKGHTNTYDKKDYFQPQALKEFLKNAFIPWHPNPGWNLNGVLVISGFLVWAIIVIGNAYGYASIPAEVTEIGKFAFYAGIGRASLALDR